MRSAGPGFRIDLNNVVASRYSRLKIGGITSPTTTSVLKTERPIGYFVVQIAMKIRDMEYREARVSQPLVAPRPG
jgi:hypothetical protein